MEKFSRLEQTAIPLDIENVDTDQIIPARFLKQLTVGFGKNFFATGDMIKTISPSLILF